MRISACAALLPLVVMGSAHALSIDFGSGPTEPAICSSTSDGLGTVEVCSNYAWISQSYGDVAGLVDVTYSSPRQATPTSIEWWNSNYNTLYGVGFAPNSDADSRGRIEIKALVAGDQVTVSSFDLGAYSFNTLNTTVRILTIGGGTTLFSYTGAVGNGSVSASHFSPNVSAVGGVWIEWQDSAWNVGIDNIQYGVSAVPEGSTVSMILAGLAALALARRGRARV
jgi:hypothetical protein